MPEVRTQEIAAEQQVVDRVYARLEGMRAQANALAGEGYRRAAVGTVTGLVERDAMVHRAAAQLRALDAEAEGLVFGRLDFDDGETYHIGRLGVRDGVEPLLVDWRAPVAEPFYRATSGEPLGVVRRRVIICRGPKPLPVQEADDDSPAEDPYLHVILDEAQDLSPMECRMIARRAEYASMTVVGDLGQATHPLAAGSWPQLLTRLGKREARTLELHTGYRVPQAIANYAARVLAPGITPTRSYRPGGALSVRQVDDLHAAVREAVRQAPRDTTIAVIATDNAAEELVPFIDVPEVTVVPASLVKGLEYDHVIVVEPADIVAAEPRGLNRLYVALTRAVASLVVLHQQTLPAALRD